MNCLSYTPVAINLRGYGGLRRPQKHSVEPDSLPDRLINPGEYEPPFHTPQRHATAEPIEGEDLVGEAQRKLIPVYIYGSIN